MVRGQVPFFKGLQFGRNVPFGIDQGLLSDPIQRNLVFVGVGYFQIKPKDLVVIDLREGMRVLWISS